MKKTIKSALTISGIAAAGAAAATYSSYITTDLLMKAALDREEPPIMKRAERWISGTGICTDFLEALEKAAIKLAHRQHEVIAIEDEKGTKLVGHWFPCQNAERTVLGMHGWRSVWCRDFGLIADLWFDNQCNVLLAEQRGQGQSGGEYMGFGLTERYDCLPWIRWVEDQCEEELPIYLGGVSMGATTVLMAAGLELPETVRGIVADCGFTSPYAIWKHVATRNLHMSFRIRGRWADRMCRKRIQMGAREYSTVDAVKTATVPILFIHGEKDHFVPVAMTYENYEACTGPKQLLIVPEADHGMSYYLAKEKYEAAIRQFWREFDGKKRESVSR